MNTEQIAENLAAFPNVLRALLGHIDPEILRWRPAEGDWCVLEIIGHMIESDGPPFEDRIASIVAGNPEIAPVSANKPVAAGQYHERDLDELLDQLTHGRVKAAEFIRTLSPEDLLKTANYTPHGTFSAGDFVYEWPYHDHDHLQQILSILKQVYLPHMTDVMRKALS